MADCQNKPTLRRRRNDTFQWFDGTNDAMKNVLDNKLFNNFNNLVK